MNSTGFTYEIEGEIDFFKELKQLSSAPDISLSLTIDDNIARCLITDEKLRKDHVALKCGHRFNYVPLFKEVLFQKCSLLPKNLSTKIITTYTKHANTSAPATNTPTTPPPTINNNYSNNVTSVLYNSSYNLETTKLNYNEMKCPYCRSITPYILPYYPYPDVCKVKYVNVPSNLSLPGVSCEYEKFISSGGGEGTDEINSCRAAICMYNEKYDLVLCTKHLNKLEAGTVLRKPVTRKSKANPKQAIDIDDENMIISHHNPATTVCSFILLAGPRKGCPCEKPMWVPKLDSLNTGAVSAHAAYCKAHYNKGVK